MATALFNLSGPSLSLRPKQLQQRIPTHSPSTNKITQASRSIDIRFQSSRRASIGLGLTALVHQLAIGPSRAEEENNGLWLTGPLPVPTVTNKIANPETGTRSFLRNGIYMANIGTHGSAYRLRMYAFDLLGLGDLLGQNAGSIVRKYLCLKSTVMYYDFDKVISAAPVDQQQPLTVLANRLFDSVEKLEHAVKTQSDPITQSCYDDTTIILKEERGFSSFRTRQPRFLLKVGERERGVKVHGDKSYPENSKSQFLDKFGDELRVSMGISLSRKMKLAVMLIDLIMLENR